ncbi:MAG TPA: thioredoxin domain-containing protein, partial [Polyangiaceae bacterium]
MSPKVLAAVGLVALSSSRLSTCRSPGEGGGEQSPPREKVVELKGIDSSALTARERTEWSAQVSELLSPCPDQPVSIAQCVNEGRKCSGCLPAARYLLEQVRRGRTRGQVEATYRARFAPDQVKNVEVGDSPSKGHAGAPVVIVEWADFECPACGAVRPVLDQLVEKYPDSVRIVFKHYPLSMHPNAEKAARAAVAGERQGKFWEMHRVLFENQTQLSPENVEKLAQGIGVDLARFRQDRDSEATADRVARDRRQGEALDLASTPSLFINGRHFVDSGELPVDLEDWVKLELELKGQAPAPVAAPASAAPGPSAAPAAST